MLKLDCRWRWLWAAVPLAVFSFGMMMAQQVTQTPAPMASDPQAVAIAAKMDARYNRLESLRADFTEHFSGLNLDRTESGVLTMKKPGRMRWDYSNPSGKTFVLDGQNAWFYSPGDAQAQHVPAKKLDDLRSPMRYLLGHAHLDKELQGLRMEPMAGGYKLTGRPKGMEQSVLVVTLEVTVEGQLMGIRVDDTDGTTTEFKFSNMQENVPLKNSDFLFTPPSGVSIVDAMPPI